MGLVFRYGTYSAVYFTDGSWWQESVQTLFDTEGTDSERIIGSSCTRLTGLGAAGLLSETITTDIHGNQTISAAHLNKPLHMTTQTVNSPASDIDSISETVYGLLKSTTDGSGITTTYEYDTLGRRIASIDPRTGQSITHYNARGEIDYSEDPENNRTTISYDPVTGRKISVMDAENRSVYYRYNSLGNITHTWGATTPVRYEYDTYERMSAMHIYKTDDGWDSLIWPEAS